MFTGVGGHLSEDTTAFSYLCFNKISIVDKFRIAALIIKIMDHLADGNGDG